MFAIYIIEKNSDNYSFSFIEMGKSKIYYPVQSKTTLVMVVN
jgi:hypothetical protein